MYANEKLSFHIFKVVSLPHLLLLIILLLTVSIVEFRVLKTGTSEVLIILTLSHLTALIPLFLHTRHVPAQSHLRHTDSTKKM